MDEAEEGLAPTDHPSQTTLASAAAFFAKYGWYLFFFVTISYYLYQRWEKQRHAQSIFNAERVNRLQAEMMRAREQQAKEWEANLAEQRKNAPKYRGPSFETQELQRKFNGSLRSKVSDEVMVRLPGGVKKSMSAMEDVADSSLPNYRPDKACGPKGG